MKKRFIYIGILSIIFMICSGVFILKKHNDNMPYKYPDGKTEFDFNKQNQPKASRILYKYILESENLTAKEAKKSKDITPNQVRAFELDLNDDGVNEIIGFCSKSQYWGTAGYSLFILKKQNEKYQNISHLLSFEPQLKIYILPSKTADYKDLILFGSSAHNFMPMVVKYDGQIYFNAEQNDLFIKYLKN